MHGNNGGKGVNGGTGQRQIVRWGERGGGKEGMGMGGRRREENKLRRNYGKKSFT
jgi:hypothetical protein